MADLITLAYAKEQAKITTTADDAQLADLITAASQAVRSFCNRDFATTSYVEDYEPHEPTYSLTLRQRPITALTSVTINPYETNPTTYAGSTFVVKTSGAITFLPSVPTVGIDFFPAARRGVPTVQVAYSAGYATIPADVQKATAMLVANGYYSAKRETGMLMERLGDYQYQLRALPNALFTEEIRALLMPYKDFICV